MKFIFKVVKVNDEYIMFINSLFETNIVYIETSKAKKTLSKRLEYLFNVDLWKDSPSMFNYFVNIMRSEKENVITLDKFSKQLFDELIKRKNVSSIKSIDNISFRDVEKYEISSNERKLINSTEKNLESKI